MRLKQIKATGYKRFTDITVELPETARLIILVGPNGCGKSSLFDALLTWQTVYAGYGYNLDAEYYSKADQTSNGEDYMQRVRVEFHGDSEFTQETYRKSIYFRSAYRNDPDVTVDRLRRMGDPLEQRRLNRLIENDVAVTQNYQKLAAKVFDFFDLEEPMCTDTFADSIIAPIRDPILKLFPDLLLNGLVNPMKDGTFRFSKGTSKKFHFKNLSGGEKAAFDLILDLALAIETYNDTVFCIDEPEAHMNTRVQAELLSVLYSMIPLNCQLMLATHSIGMMRRAKDLATSEPEDVIFLDFSNRDLDQPTTIVPAEPNRVFWRQTYEIALDDLAELVAPERVVICEGEPGSPSSAPNHAHDARCYESIFQNEFPDTAFVPGGNASEVMEDKRGVAYALRDLTQGVVVTRLVDRDARSKEEIEDLRGKGIRVLTYRNLESCLFCDEILTLLAHSVNQVDEVEPLLAKKEEIKTKRYNDAPDDLKPASGEIYVACKSILNLTNPGNDAKTFMRDTLSKLVTNETQVYMTLRSDIFGEDQLDPNPVP